MSEQQEDPYVLFDHVSVAYPKEEELLIDVSFQLDPGQFYFLTGASGTGKSSLLKLIYLAMRPSKGRIAIFGRQARGLKPHERSRLRQSMGIVFQDFKLLEHLSVVDNVSLPLRMRGFDPSKSHKQAQDLLDWVGVEPDRRFPASLSGGEKQRVAIARSVIAKPKLLLADEPTGNIDDDAAFKITRLFEELHNIGTTVLLATHNHNLIAQFPYTVLNLHQKKLKLTAPTPYPIAKRSV